MWERHGPHLYLASEVGHSLEARFDTTGLCENPRRARAYRAVPLLLPSRGASSRKALVTHGCVDTYPALMAAMCKMTLKEWGAWAA